MSPKSHPHTLFSRASFHKISTWCWISIMQAQELWYTAFTIDQLRSVTNNFAESNVLGQGGFRVVYKGVLADGTKIDVKRIQLAVVSSKGLSELRSDIAILTKVKHRHLVALLGYCTDGIERLLCTSTCRKAPWRSICSSTRR
ncbi:hypothetical protein KC19_8G124400 [Ceratodon purpureus]|uniref:Protein kinase domain-containing protein n=1 Tax=Ceratodon purpureus TaxID=3225 RepID=A0A8T0H666_CERPU|nr:hypothetical protein KC19_8G124400 [Ceratodon purpureus]